MLIPQGVTDKEAFIQFLRTLQPKNKSQEIWFKVGHNRLYVGEFTTDGRFPLYETVGSGKNRRRERIVCHDAFRFLDGESRKLDGGVFYIPTQPQGYPLKECVDSTDDIGIEMDSLSTEEQWIKYQTFQTVTEIEYSSLLTSGGKSIHAHIKAEQHLPVEKAQYLRRLATISFLSDPAVVNLHQPMRLPGFYRKEKGTEQRLLQWSLKKYTFDELVNAFRKWFEYQGLDFPAFIPDDWWSKCLLPILTNRKKLSEAQKLEELKAALAKGLEGFQQEQLEADLERQRKLEARLQLKQAGQSNLFELLDEANDRLGRDAFNLFAHNWKWTGDKARGLCFGHESTTGTAAWIAPLQKGSGWGYACPTCTGNDPINAFTYWRYVKHGMGATHPKGREFVELATEFLRLAGIEPPPFNSKHKGLHKDAKTLLKQWQLEAKSEQKMKDIESQEAEAEEAETPLEIDHPQEFEPSTFELILQSCEGLKEISNPVERLDKVKGLLDLAAEKLDRIEQSTVVDQIAAATKIQKTVLREHLKEAIAVLRAEQREKDRAEKKKAAKFQALSKIPLVVTETGDERAPMQSACAHRISKPYRSTMAWDYKKQSFFRYNTERGIWEEEPIDTVKALVVNELKGNGLTDLFSGRYVADVIELLKSELLQKHWKTPRNLLPMLNGVLDINTGKLHPHSPERFLTWQLPYKYNLLAKCLNIIAWLTEMQDNDPQRVQLLRAWLRAVVTRSGASLQRFLECLGPGGTGKSTLLNLVIALVGVENVHATTLKQWEESRFDTANAYGKLLLYFTDSERYTGSVSNLKAATGGDPLRLERKNKQQEGTFTFEGTVVLAANEAIAANDHTSGLSRRKVTIPFTHVIPPEKRRDLLNVSRDEISGEFANELPGLLNWVLEMTDEEMRNLILRTHELVPSLAETQIDTLISNNSIAAWIDSNCVLIPGALTKIGEGKKIRVSTGDSGQTISSETYQNVDTLLYANYLQYCSSTGTSPFKLQRFSTLLLDLLKTQLKIFDVEKIRTSQGVHIKGLAIRTDAHQHLPSPITGRNEDLSEDPMKTLVKAETLTCEDYEGNEDFPKNTPYTQASNIPPQSKDIYHSPIGNELEAKSLHSLHSLHQSDSQPSPMPSLAFTGVFTAGQIVCYVGSRYPAYTGEVLKIASVKGGDVSCQLPNGKYTAILRPEELQILLEV